VSLHGIPCDSAYLGNVGEVGQTDVSVDPARSLFCIVQDFELMCDDDGESPFLAVDRSLLTERRRSMTLPQYVRGFRVHSPFSRHYSPSRRNTGVRRVSYSVRMQPCKRRAYLALLVSVRARFGWRADLSWATALMDAQQLTRKRWMYLDQANPHPLTGAGRNMQILESAMMTADDLAQIAADWEAIVDTFEVLLAQLPPVALLTLFLELQRSADIEVESERATGPPPGDKPPQLADVDSLLTAPHGPDTFTCATSPVRVGVHAA
jgi:hypothetical protein